MKKILPTVLAALALAGCANYRWTSPVPADMRTVSVPTVQGVLKTASSGLVYYKREMSMRAYEQRLVVSAEVSFVDRRSGKVIVDNRKYVAETTYFSDTDMATSRRDASGRAAEDLARQIVDDVVSCRWDNAKAKEEAK